MTNKRLDFIKEIVSGRQTSSPNLPIPRKKQTGKREKIIINPEYRPLSNQQSSIGFNALNGRQKY
jgi:hypothetical protein